ncbi:MAG: DoxX family protein [Pseudomonadota bacterium]
MRAFDTFLAAYAPQLRSVARFMLGLLVLQHGTIKHLNIPVNERMNAIDLSSLPGIAGVFELVCGTLLVVGLFSRVSAFLLSGLTACAYFLVYAGNGFFPISNGGELAAVYCFAFLWLAAEGPGPWSLDALVRRPAQI